MYPGGHFEAEGSNSWQQAAGAAQVRSDGWPLGLQQNPVTTRGFPQAPAFFASTPSITSESSSDLDTESTGSFFPERSQTLGSLIGIQSNGAQSEQSKAMAESYAMAETSERRRSASSTRPGRAASWCPMLGCRGGGSNAEALGMSPSLAHLLEEERRATGSQRQSSSSSMNEGGGAAKDGSVLGHRNTLFDEGGILPPHPSGAPLRLILQHSSPNSSYLSADWNVFNATRHPHHQQGSTGAGGHGRFPSFWPTGLCGRLGPAGLAG